MHVRLHFSHIFLKIIFNGRNRFINVIFFLLKSNAIAKNFNPVKIVKYDYRYSQLLFIRATDFMIAVTKILRVGGTRRILPIFQNNATAESAGRERVEESDVDSQSRARTTGKSFVSSPTSELSCSRGHRGAASNRAFPIAQSMFAFRRDCNFEVN